MLWSLGADCRKANIMEELGIFFLRKETFKKKKGAAFKKEKKKESLKKDCRKANIME